MLQLYKPQGVAVFAILLFAFLLITAQQTFSQTAIQFDGTNDYVTFGQATTTLGAQSFTLECWFKRTGTGLVTTTGGTGSTGGIKAIPLVTKGRGESDVSVVDANYFLGINSPTTGYPFANNVLVADFEEGTGTTNPGRNHPVGGKTPIVNNVWYHAAVTYDAPNLRWRLYLNGTLEKDTVIEAGTRFPQYLSTQHAGLGTAMTSSGIAEGAFAGIMDEVRIWNLARTQAEIQATVNQEITSGTGLLGRWGLNDGSGTTATNSIAGSPNGTLTNGPTWVSGITFPPELWALQFNGSSQYVTSGVTPSNSPLNAQTFTVETWFRRDGTGISVSTGGGGITAIPLITKGTSEADNSANADVNYFLGINTTGNVLCADFEEGQTGSTPGLNHPISGITAIANGTWYHVAATYDGTKWQLFLNGNLEAELVVGQPPNAAVISPFAMATSIRSNGTTIQGYFNGVLDEVRLWNYARSQSEIQAGINLEITSDTGLLGRWSLDEGTGTTATNSIALSPNGTLTGGPLWSFGAPFNIAFTPPAAPTNLNATAISTTQINLSWTDNASTEAAFEIERSTGGAGGPFTLLATVSANTTSYSDVGLTQSTPYWYQVRAVNGGGNSSYTNVANATTFSPTPPTAPSGLTASAPSAYQVNLSWTDNSNDETSFEIERSTTGIGGTYSLLTTVAANTISYNDVTVSPTNEYCYRVRAVNGAGPSSYTDPSCATTPAEGDYALSFGSSNSYVTFGTAPSLGTSTFTLEAWINKTGTGVTTGTGTGGLTAALPIISKGRGEEETPANLNMNYFLGIDNTGKLAADFEDKATGLNHPVTGVATLSNNTWYHIAATYDGTTWKLYLNGDLDRELIVGAFLPENTSIQHAALGSALTSTGVAAGYFAGIIDEARIWNYAKTIEQIQSDINSQITTGQTGLLARWGLNEGTGTTVSSSAGTSVTGTIIGTGSSWPTPGAPFNISFAPPNAPSGLTATAPSAYQVSLSWTDNSNNETNFEIERSTTGIGGTYSLLATVGANTTSYNDATVSPTIEYCYRVRAINGIGSSAYSNSDCATPLEADYALDFGTGTAYVTFGNNAALALANITVETWFKREGTGTTANTGTGGIYAIPLVTKGRGEQENSNVDMNYFLGIRASDNVLAADFEEGASGTTPGLNHPVYGTTPIVNDVWYHAAATYDGTTWYLYLNGNLEAQLYIGQPLRSDCVQHAGLGTAMNSTGVTEGHFDGVLDEVRIWNYARTSGEIVSTINSEINAVQTGLVARWGLNEGTGTSVTGSAGTSITGTITGTGSGWVTPGAPFNISFTPPTAPTNLVVTTNSSSELQLSWTDNSDNESGFEIERSTTGIGGTYSILTTVAANTTMYLDQNLFPQTEYCYQVRAINPGGSSAYTNAYCATTDFEPAVATLTFQEGVNGYSGTVDTYIWSAPTEVNSSFGGNEEVQWDGSDLPPGQTVAGEQDAIIRFENIFGAGTGQIPPTAVIQSATLTYTVFDMGNEANVYNVLVNNWSEATSWNTFGSNPGIQAEDFNSTQVASTTGSSAAGEKNINVTSSITSWLANPSENYGWLFRPTGNSGVGFRSSEYGTITARPKLTVSYLANPPNQPVLVAPLDNSLNISTSPQLSVMVSDPESRNLTVKFYGRQVSSSTPGEDFTVVAIPDAQNYTAGLSGGTMAMFTAQTNWCVTQQVARNIVYVAMEGDITNDNNTTQWANGVTAMSILENPAPGIPYAISIGNHDGAPTNTTLYNDNFGISRFTGRPYYGGHYGSDNNNNFSLFSAGGMDFIVITLGFGNATPTTEVFAWANNLMQTYSTRRAIVMSHDLLSGNNWTTAGQAIYDALKGNPNLFLMLAGHLDTEGLRTDTFNGNTIYTVRTDYQGTGSGGNGWLRFFTFSPANNNMTITSYSPYLNQYNFGGNSPIVLPYEMSVTNDYVLIGTNTSVTSGSTTSINWPGRLNNTEYEWYVEVSNGESAITGPTWSFTTEQAALPEYEVYLSSSTSASTATFYPNTDWAETPYEGSSMDDWNFTSPISLYIVPEFGSVFGASDITIEWDNTKYSYAGVENTGIYSGSDFQVLHSTNGTTDQVVINAARLDNNNFTISTGEYIGKLKLNLIKSGYGTINFTSLSFIVFDGLGGQTSVTVTGNDAEIKSYLGDVASSSSTSAGDGLVDFEDLVWASSYWSGVGGNPLTNYKIKYDVGPTTTSTVYGIPEPDAKIQFEDLIIFSMSYGLSAGNGYPKIEAEPTEPVDLRLGEPIIAGGQTRIPLYVTGGVQNVRAMSLTFTGQFGKLVSVEKGNLLKEFTNPVMLLNNTENNMVKVDLAVFGAEELGINSEGEVLTLIFEGRAEININIAEVRNILNAPMAVNISGSGGSLPKEFALLQNYPNPFNPSTIINYNLPKQAMVELSIYNALGERVAMLVNEIKEAGRHNVEFNASGYSSGIYFYKIKANDPSSGSGQSFVTVKKMILLK